VKEKKSVIPMIDEKLFPKLVHRGELGESITRRKKGSRPKARFFWQKIDGTLMGNSS